jgi:hypothetical protein
VLAHIIQGFPEATATASSSEEKEEEGKGGGDLATAGAPLELPAELRELFRSVLLPLHRPNGFFEWRDQLPLLQTYHEPLMACLLQLLRRRHGAAAPELLPELFAELVEAWPEGYSANTAKEVPRGEAVHCPILSSTL